MCVAALARGDEVLDQLHHLVRRLHLREMTDVGQDFEPGVGASLVRGVRVIDGDDAIALPQIAMTGKSSRSESLLSALTAWPR